VARVLAIDLGERRIGVALSDASQTLASPLTTVTRSGDPVRDRRAVVDLANEYEASTIVVGMPLSMSGERGKSAQAAADEITELQRIAGDSIAVVAIDERLTTVSAQRMLDASGVRRKDQRSRIDQAAATVMLQHYLDARQ
jgi:putative Holliday junction resolvase